jgi:hypothetical protein
MSSDRVVVSLSSLRTKDTKIKKIISSESCEDLLCHSIDPSEIADGNDFRVNG